MIFSEGCFTSLDIQTVLNLSQDNKHYVTLNESKSRCLNSLCQFEEKPDECENITDCVQKGEELSVLLYSNIVVCRTM
jgi:hypothetical protein